MWQHGHHDEVEPGERPLNNPLKAVYKKENLGLIFQGCPETFCQKAILARLGELIEIYINHMNTSPIRIAFSSKIQSPLVYQSNLVGQTDE